MQLTAQMLREAFQQTQREILADGSPERYQARWQRMAEVLNEKIASEQEALKRESDARTEQE